MRQPVEKTLRAFGLPFNPITTRVSPLLLHARHNLEEIVHHKSLEKRESTANKAHRFRLDRRMGADDGSGPGALFRSGEHKG
jgi:hypothetical protein